MIELALIPYYGTVNRWIGSGAKNGKFLGRILFALPIAAAEIAVHPQWIFSGSAVFIWVYLTRNLPHGKNYTMGHGAITSGIFMDYLYMLGKGGVIFLPIALIDLTSFFMATFSWPAGYLIGWAIAKGDKATFYSEIICGLLTGFCMATLIQVKFQ